MSIEDLLIDTPRRNLPWIILLLLVIGTATMLLRGC